MEVGDNRRMKIKLLALLAACSVVACQPAAKVEPQTEGEPATTESAETLSVNDVDAKTAAELIENNADLVVLDVRTAEEFGQGHIAGAVNLDFTAPGFKDEVAKLDKRKSYLLHCRSGRRSTDSLPVFKELGFSEIHHLAGGFNEWKDAGNPVSTD